MELTGIKVFHTSGFGYGEVVSQNGNYITVKFDTKENPIKFVYPDCFKTFLRIENTDISEEVSKELEKKKGLKKQIPNQPTNNQL